MNNSKRSTDIFSAFKHLLGFKQTTSQQVLSHELVGIDYLCVILVCIGAGYFAALQGFDSLPVNADSFAPFEEAKSLISNPETHLFNIHFSRIPSIFPDITINALVQLIFPKAGFLEIFSIYSWVTSSLFLLLATLLIQQIQSVTQSLTAISIRVSLVTVSLLNISHQFNIIYAHVITPVHHGGNILNTLLLLTLALQLLKRTEARNIRLALLILTTLAVLSNKIAIFTAAFPIGFLIVCYLRGNERRNSLIQLALATAAGLVLGSLLNEQCANPKINLFGTGSAFIHYFQLSWITSVSALFSILSLWFICRSKSTLSQSTSAGLTAISLSSLSYFLYLPVITSSGDAPIRYICIAYALIVVFFGYYINTMRNYRYPIVLITLVTVTVLSFKSPVGPYLNLKEHQSLKQALLERSERIEPFKNDAARFIHKMGYDNYLGLGDYWTAGAALVTNSKLQIVPILKSGNPDFWGATPQDIKQQIKPLDKSKAYVVVEYLQSRVNQKFQKKIQSKYGEPDIIWNYNDENRTFTKDEIDTNNKILVYDNPEIYKRISRKSKKFKRECNKASPNYRVR